MILLESFHITPIFRTFFFSECCCCSVSESCLILCDPMDYTARQAPPSLTISQNLLKFMAIESVMLSNHLILCHPPFLLPSIFPSIRVSSNESAVCIRWPKHWSFRISPSNKYSDLTVCFWFLFL